MASDDKGMWNRAAVERLAWALNLCGLTRDQIARNIDVHPKTAEYMLNASRDSFPAHTFVKVAGMLNVSLDFLMGLTNTPEAADPERPSAFMAAWSIHRRTTQRDKTG